MKNKPYMVGWIECKRDLQADLTKLGEELLERQRVFLIKYSEYADLYLIHPSMLKKEVSRQLEWYPRVPLGQRKPKVVLLYIIYMRDSKTRYEKIDPIFIGMPDQALEKKEAELQITEFVEVEEADILSPLTSLGGDDVANGESINNLQFNMMNMMGMSNIPGMPHIQGMGNMSGMRGGNPPMNFQQIMNQGMMRGQMKGMGHHQEMMLVNRGGHVGNFGIRASEKQKTFGNQSQNRMMKGGMINVQKDFVVENEDIHEIDDEEEEDDEIEEEFDDEEEEDEDGEEELEEEDDEQKSEEKKKEEQEKVNKIKKKNIEEIEIEEINDDAEEELEEEDDEDEDEEEDEDQDEDDDGDGDDEIEEEIKKTKMKKDQKKSEEIKEDEFKEKKTQKKSDSMNIDDDDDDMEIIEMNPSNNRSSRQNRRDQTNLLNNQLNLLNMQDQQNLLLMQYPNLFNQGQMMYDQMSLQSFEMMLAAGGMGQDLTQIFGERPSIARKPSK